MYQNMLITIMYLNNYDFIKDYPYMESLTDLKNTEEVEDYCKKVLSNLNQLVEINIE